MERINRLTEKNKYDIYCPKKEVSILDLSAKLGQLEDLMEELNIDNVEELGEYIHDLNIYVGAYANDPPEKTQQIVKDLNTVAKLRKELNCPVESIVFMFNIIDKKGFLPLLVESMQSLYTEEGAEYFMTKEEYKVFKEYYPKRMIRKNYGDIDEKLSVFDKEWKDEA